MFFEEGVIDIYDGSYGTDFSCYEYKLPSQDKHKLILSKMSSINFLVGSNNSGKSRFLREIMLLIEKIQTSERGYVESGNNSEALSNAEIQALSQNTAIHIDNDNIEKFNFDEFLKILTNQSSGQIISDKDFIAMLDKILNNELKYSEYNTTMSRALSKMVQIIRQNKNIVYNNLLKRKISSYKLVYIPIMRSTVNLFDSINDIDNQNNRSNVIYDTVVKNYFLGKTKLQLSSHYNGPRKRQGNISVFTGSELYEEIKKNLLGNQEQRDAIKKYQDFLSEFVFDSRNVVLIPKHTGSLADDHTLFVNIDGVDREIYNVGDGVQSLIIATYPMFMMEKGIFFIEEPELHLHPGYQRRFIEILAHFSKTKSHKFFLTTHSNHFLDRVFEDNDISIFNFKRVDQTKFQISLASYQSRDSLSILGVQNSSVFLSNCVIWVEGPSDRLYFKKFLELALENEPKYQPLRNILKEGIHYCFCFTGGSMISSFDFTQLIDSDPETVDPRYLSEHLDNNDIPVKNLVSRSMVIIDNDKDSSAKNPQKEKLKSEILDGYHCYEKAIELENLLPYKAILKLIKNNPKTSSWHDVPDEKFKRVYQTQISKKRLGSLIIEDILPTENYPKIKYTNAFKQSGQQLDKTDGAALSSTLKVPFANLVYELLEFDDFDEDRSSYEAFDIVDSMIEFILSHNSDIKLTTDSE